MSNFISSRVLYIFRVSNEWTIAQKLSKLKYKSITEAGCSDQRMNLQQLHGSSKKLNSKLPVRQPEEDEVKEPSRSSKYRLRWPSVWPRTARRSRGSMWGGMIWLPGCLGSQFTKLNLQKNPGGGQSTVSPGKSPFLVQRKKLNPGKEEDKMDLSDLDAPPLPGCLSPPRVLGAPERWGEPKWPRVRRPSPRNTQNLSPQQNKGI